MLLRVFLDILHDWHSAFPRSRSWRRAVAQALGTLTALGRRTLSRAIWAGGRQQEDWSADYKLHARTRWEPADLFQPILHRALPLCKGRYIAVAIDDTRLRKTGIRIPHVAWWRDPLSPKFRFNLMRGLRFLHVALLVPLYHQSKASPRALPVRFEEAPVLKKPRRRASAEERAEYRRATKVQNLSTRAVEVIRGLRAALDRTVARTRKLLIVADNSFCNRTLFGALTDRTELIARARRDIKLCRRASRKSKRFYHSDKFTPEQVLQDNRIPWQKLRIFHGGQWRKIRYKELTAVLWQSGARQRLLRLFVIAPIPYQAPGRKRKYYSRPAFLLTTDLQGSPRELVQPYFDRWQIEVNHREMKDTLGVGQAQVRSSRSVPRQPAFAVAAYSALMLAGLLAFGPQRGEPFEALPRWRRNAPRPSCLDLVTLLRKQINANPALVIPFGFRLDWKSLGLAAVA
jgi:DDE superfamily endonuclease